MIRSTSLLLLSCALIASGADPAAAQTASSHSHAKGAAKKPAAGAKPTTEAPAAPAKPALVGTFGAWGAYTTSGKDPTCYALAQPSQREPADLVRDPGYLFISTRPAEHVRNEISIAMGFEVKDAGATAPQAAVGKTIFPMVAKGSDLWLKADGQDAVLLAAMKKGEKLVVKAASMRGKVTTDTYALSELTQALEKLSKSCK
jgi:hypothetical protein